MQPEENGCEKVLWPFSGSNEGKNTRTRQVKTIAVNIFFCDKKHKAGLFVCHLEGLRVPQFGNHCSSVYVLRVV